MKEGIEILGSTGGKGDSIVLTITAQRCSEKYICTFNLMMAA